MATGKMVKMGIRRKDMYPSETTSPKSEKDYDKEVVRPELRLTGPQAEMMGAEDLKKGDRVRQTVEWVVTDHVKREANGKPTEYEMTLCLDKAGDHEECGADDEDSEDAKGDAKPSPAMAYITAQGKDSD